MLDSTLRPVKDRILDPAVRLLIRTVHPNHVTIAAFVFGIGAALAAAMQFRFAALALWFVNRILDGLDGAIARAAGLQSDRGGYLDIVLDFVVYAVVPFGVVYSAGVPGAWQALSLLFAVFYVNAASWMYLSALLEKRSAGDTSPTSVIMPTGVVEGTETIVVFALFLLFPNRFVLLALIMSGLTLIGAAQRVIWGMRNL